MNASCFCMYYVFISCTCARNSILWLICILLFCNFTIILELHLYLANGYVYYIVTILNTFEFMSRLSRGIWDNLSSVTQTWNVWSDYTTSFETKKKQFLLSIFFVYSFKLEIGNSTISIFSNHLILTARRLKPSKLNVC